MSVMLALMLEDCVSPHLLCAFVYVFRGESERETEKTQVKTAASAACSRLQQNSAYVHRIQPRRLSGPSFLSRLSLTLASENVNICAQQMRANAIGKHEGQRHWHSYSPRFTPQTFLLLVQLNPNCVSPNELFLKRRRCRASLCKIRLTQKLYGSKAGEKLI